jgi:hypothetical protein
VLVLTDHVPDPVPAPDRMRWWAFGTPRPNWAFVNAGRAPGPRGDRLLLEVANLAADARSTVLRVETGTPARELHRSELKLNGGESQRVVLELPENAAGPPPTVRASVAGDDLPFDDAVSLVPAGRKLVRYDVRLTDPKLKSTVERAVSATGSATTAEDRPHLVFLDGDVTAPPDESAWAVRVLTEPEAEAFTGPFVLDRSHPLTEGLSLAGVVWGGGKPPLPGGPVVMAGNVPLLTDTESATGRHELRLRLRPDLSTLTESPAWPTLIWNLVRWRASHLPGLDRANVRLGEEVAWTMTAPAETVEVTPPGGAVTPLPARGRRVVVRADRPGVYKLQSGDEIAAFGSNPLRRDESDLTKCASGRTGDELDATTLRLEYRDAAWVPVLLALAVAVVHLWAVARSSGTGRI